MWSWVVLVFGYNTMFSRARLSLCPLQARFIWLFSPQVICLKVFMADFNQKLSPPPPPYQVKRSVECDLIRAPPLWHWKHESGFIEDPLWSTQVNKEKIKIQGRTYPGTLLWETFTSSAAVSTSTLAAVLLPTLSDTKTNKKKHEGLRWTAGAQRTDVTCTETCNILFAQPQICAHVCCLVVHWDILWGKVLCAVGVTNSVCAFCGL